MIDKAILSAEKISLNKNIEVPLSELKKIISLIDYTSLNDTDHSASILKWTSDSLDIMRSVSLHFAAWCVYPEFISLLDDKRKDFPISIAVVCGNFPSGKALTQIKIEESTLAEAMGADEIDIVINKGWAREGSFQKIEKEIHLIKGALANAHLKVIMETGLLDNHQIYEISKAAIRGGADFIKTSTGKINEGASLKAVAIMCYAIKEHYDNTGIKIGIKPSGGIATPEEAYQYVQLVRSILGEEWINNKLFRIGASRLLTNTVQKVLDYQG
jgi:deoxyribose-phosphate aldolase